MTHKNRHRRRQRGFSLIESLLVIVILLIVLGVATDALVQMQKRSSADQGKVDMNQMARQFMDQITNDLHQTGYPSAYMYAPSPAPTPDPNTVAVGFISLTANSAEFEADVDNSGTVSHVYLQLLGTDGQPIASGNGLCPCILQRGVLAKASVGTKVPYYTEVNNVLNTDIFSADDHTGTTVAFPITAFTNIRVVRLKVNLKSTVPEVDGSYPTITMQSAAKIMNLKLN